jgi:hypothetical protein
MGRASLVPLCIAAGLLAGCPEWEHDDELHAGDDDTSGPGDDDAGDDDSADAHDKPPTTAGQSMLYFAEFPSGNGGMTAHASFSAEFKEVVDPGQPGEFVFEMPDSTDSCAVTVYGASDLDQGTGGSYVYHSAGQIALSGPTGTFTADPLTEDDRVSYYLDLAPDQQVIPGSEWSVAGEGDAIPAFDGDGVLELPARVELLDPLVGPEFTVDGDLALSWDGGGSDTLWIELGDADKGDEDNTTIYCSVHNDGSFVVEAKHTDLLPDDFVTLTIAQSVTTFWHVEAMDDWIAFQAATTVGATGVVARD